MGNAINKSSTIHMLKKYWQLITVFALFLFVQWPILANWWGIWNEKDSYYSHGPIVPLITAFMIWTKRKALTSEKLVTNWYGALLLLIALPVHAIAMVMEMRVLYMFSFFGILFGLVLLLCGWRVFKILFVPLAFLVTMIPIASWAIDAATGNAQLISAAVAEKFFTLAGYEVQRYGNTIISNDLPQPLLVGSPCSGLRLLISLITFSWFFIYVINGKWWKKGLLMAFSFPLAVFINSLRIALIGFVGFWWYSADYMHKFHDYSGYIGLVLCFIILFGTAKLLKMGDFNLDSAGSSEGANTGQDKKVAFHTPSLVIVVIGLAFIGCISNFVKPLYDLPKGNLHRETIPRVFGNWTSEELPIDSETRRILGKGDLISLCYSDNTNNRRITVFLDAASDISAFHDPHLCLTGGGNPIINEKQVDIDFKKPNLPVRATVFNTGGDEVNAIVLHWYMYGKNSYPLTGDVAQVKRANMISDLKRIIANPFSLNELRKEVKHRQFMWYRFSASTYDNDKADYKMLEAFAKEFVAHKKNFGE